jgi:ArsR family metal-binding transcriptional regulator
VNTDIKREILYSYKLKTAVLRTQIISDMNEMIINVSRSGFCSDASDDNMMLNMKIYKTLSKTDCTACDGGYNLFNKNI